MSETKKVRIAAMIGPDGQIVLDSTEMPSDLKPDWAMLWDFTEEWDCEETDIRRCWVTLDVPILGPNTAPDVPGSIEVTPTPTTKGE